MKRVLAAIEVGAWAGFFAFAALALALRFWLLPDIERFRPYIVAAVSQAIGQPVKIGGIQAGWLGLRPQLQFSDVRIYDAEGREALVLPAVENVVSWKTLAFRSLRLHSLAIERPRLEIRRDASGALYVAGMRLSDKKGESGFTDWLLAQDEIEIRGAEIEWRDERRAAPPLALSALDFRLRNDGERHSIGLSARPPDALGSTLDVRAEVSGRSVTDLAAWNGRVFAELGYTELAGWRAWLDYPLEIRHGRGALRVWATLEQGTLRRATADFELAEVVARLHEDLPVLELASLRGRLKGALGQSAFEVAGKGLALVPLRGAPLAPADFRVVWEEHGGNFNASQLELEPLAQLAHALPLPAALRKQLSELAPRGRLIDARAEWKGAFDKPERLSARMRFAELSAAAREGLPGFSGLSGSAEFTQDLGTLSLSAKNAQLHLPRVFAERLRFDSLTGNVEWERSGGRLNVRLPTLVFSNAHLAGTAQGSYVHAGEGPGTVDLSVSLSRADGRHTAVYLPLAGIMGAATRDWVARAIVAGQASDVRFRLKGDLRHFPFTDPAQGDFEVSARVHKAVLDYASGWPRIYDIEGELHFHRDRMEIIGRSGAILGTRLANVRVSIASLAARPAQLAIAGQAEGPTEEFLQYVEATPVRRMVNGFTDRISATGRGRLGLKLAFPLDNPAAAAVAGDYDFANNTVSVHPQLPAIERATGRVSFTETSLSLHDIRARLFAGAAVITGGSRAGGGFQATARGEASVAAMRGLFDHPLMRYVGGTAPYVASVHVRDGHARVGFESSLRGVSSALPAPFAKTAGETLPLRVDVIPGESDGRDRVSLVVGRVAAAELLRRKQGASMVVQRAGIWLSPGAEPLAEHRVRLPERPGTLIYGSLPALDLDRWLALGDGGGESASLGVQATAFDVRFGVLDAFGKRLTNVSLRAGSDAVGWSATIKADELAGDVSYRGEAGGLLVARLAHLRIPDDSPNALSQEGVKKRDFPAVDLIADRFTFRGKQLGRIELAAQRAGVDWRIDKIVMVNPEASLTGKGLWHTAPASRTQLEFQLAASDGGKFLERMGYPNLVKGGKTQVNGTLAWAGDPTALDFPSLAGHIEMRSEAGQFLEIEPGLGKLISLMSLQALPRRIALDFSDVFSKGFQFDRIVANAPIDKGVMTVREFKMRGSAAEVEISGETDLARETQRLRVRVVPSLGDTASAVVGIVNPVAGVASAIAQRVLKNPLGQIFAYEYSVTGTWSDPKVEKLSPAEPLFEKTP